MKTNAALKGAVKNALKYFGLELRRIPKGAQAYLAKPLDHERDATEYDHIWGDNIFVKTYLDATRKAFYTELLAYSTRHGVFEKAEAVADVGCGPGYLLKLISEKCNPKRLVGYDFSSEVLSVAKGIAPEAEFVQHDIYAELHAQFDLLFCTETLEHLYYPHKALIRLLTAAPTVVITVPNGRIDTYPGHINFWSLESWKLFMEEYEGLYNYNVQYICSDSKLLTIMRRKGDAPGTSVQGQARERSWS